MQADNRGHIDLIENIEDKAYLGNRSIISVNINCDSIGNWAFAHCKNLNRVIIKNNQVKIGRDAFLGCDNLLSISIGKAGNEYLIPVVLRLINKPGLISEPDNKWYNMIDEYIFAYLLEPDDNGFEGLWTFGEEDYVEDAFDIDIFTRKAMADKCRIILERLSCDDYLKRNHLSGAQERYINYLKEKLGKPGSWGPLFDVINCENKRIPTYITVLKKYGVIDASISTSLLQELNIGVEARAVFIKDAEDNDETVSVSKLDIFFDSI